VGLSEKHPVSLSFHIIFSALPMLEHNPTHPQQWRGYLFFRGHVRSDDDLPKRAGQSQWGLQGRDDQALRNQLIPSPLFLPSDSQEISQQTFHFFFLCFIYIWMSLLALLSEGHRASPPPPSS